MITNKRVMKYTATYEGKEHTLGVKPWCVLVNRSPTFIYKHLALAKAEGMTPDQAMQYAIEQETSYGRCGSKTKKNKITPEQRAEESRQRNESIRRALFHMGSQLRSQGE